MPVVPVAPATHQVGPFAVSDTPDCLTLRYENRGSLGIKGCLFFGFIMLGLLCLGVLSVVQTSEKTRMGMDDPSRLLAPTHNHFGFLWMFGLIALFVGFPVYVMRAYQSALTFTFDKEAGVFRRDKRIVCKLPKIEHLRIKETRDPDSKYLYLLEILYNDGHAMLLHNAYNEREIMNLANEIGAFVDRQVVWR